MMNRAKCKLCLSVIQSFHSTDYVTCKCGEIYVDGGDALKCGAVSWNNFLRVDENGNEIIVKVQQDDNNEVKSFDAPSKEELTSTIEHLIKNIEDLPDHAKYTTLNQYDMYSLLLIMKSMIKI